MYMYNYNYIKATTIANLYGFINIKHSFAIAMVMESIELHIQPLIITYTCTVCHHRLPKLLKHSASKQISFETALDETTTRFLTCILSRR